MLKVPKSLLIRKEVWDVMVTYQGETGATFSRTAIAALLCFFFGSPTPEPVWMKATMALERGEITVADLPRFVEENR